MHFIDKSKIEKDIVKMLISFFFSLKRNLGKHWLARSCR